jgi:2'-5' RNA ligase
VRQVTETAVIVSVPAAEPLVGRHRKRLDRAAAWGVPAHVTILYPFVPPPALDDDVLVRLSAAIRSVPRFEARWVAPRWFGEDVLWLAPEPDEPFRALTSAVAGAFPAHPPYGGQFEDVVPHLTVGDTGTVEGLREAERQIAPHLPISMQVATAELWSGDYTPHSWQPVTSLPLG